jgi:hypothetical protein
MPGVVRWAGEGEQLGAHDLVTTIKIAREELSLIELDLGPALAGPESHAYDDHVDAF